MGNNSVRPSMLPFLLYHPKFFKETGIRTFLKFFKGNRVLVIIYYYISLDCDKIVEKYVKL